jgi:hypothetical protein
MSKWRKVENLLDHKMFKEHFIVMHVIFPSDSDFDLNFLPCAIC